MIDEKDYEGIYQSYYKKDFEDWDFKKKIEYNNNEVRVKAKYIFFQQTYDYLVENSVNGDYYEFGCHKARTFRMSLSEARKKELSNMRFFAFDSFEGLPEASEIDRFPGWEAGKLKTSEEFFDKLIEEHGVYVDNVIKVKGFFRDSLDENLAARLSGEGSKVSLAYIDCDFYESTVPVLEFILPFLQEGAVIAFDDWNNFKASPDKGERRAFREFCKKYKKKVFFEEFLSFGWMGKSFTVHFYE